MVTLMEHKEMPAALQAPFPYYGGKSRAAPLIWERLGDVPNLVEPFFGSGAVLLARPHPPRIETVNDLDCAIVNVWRAMQRDPEGLAQICDEPVNEVTQHAFHLWLVEPGRRQAFEAALVGDPEHYDLTRAARWLVGICAWIGSGWCSGQGPWQIVEGVLVDTRLTEGAQGQGVRRQRPHLGNAGQGIHRQLPHLGNAGRGIHRQLPHLGDAGRGGEGLYAWLAALAQRLRYVRVCCGDWTRVLGPSVTWKHGLSGIVLDPPYSTEEDRTMDLYVEDSGTVAHDVRAWCVENGGNPLLRIAFCGYGTVHDVLLRHGWTKEAWSANGGFSNQRKGPEKNGNKYREVIYFSPHCLGPRQPTLFEATPCPH